MHEVDLANPGLRADGQVGMSNTRRFVREISRVATTATSLALVVGCQGVFYIGDGSTPQAPRAPSVYLNGVNGLAESWCRLGSCGEAEVVHEQLPVPEPPAAGMPPLLVQGDGIDVVEATAYTGDGEDGSAIEVVKSIQTSNEGFAWTVGDLPDGTVALSMEVQYLGEGADPGDATGRGTYWWRLDD